MSAAAAPPGANKIAIKQLPGLLLLLLEVLIVVVVVVVGGYL